MIQAEKSRLEDIATDSKYVEGVNKYAIEYSFEVFQRYLQNGPTLEMGPAEGIMTERLVQVNCDLTVLEGSSQFCENLHRRHPGIQVVESLFEDYIPDKKFSNIVLGHVLEHVEDPVNILGKAREWLAENGIILAAVPNSRSIHRQAGVLLGQLPIEDALNDADRIHGHRRVYNPESFRYDFMSAGLKIDIFGGYWLKPVSNEQIMSSFNEDMVHAFMKLGERYPDIAGEIYIVASSCLSRSSHRK